jgi:uncharacterized protein
MTPSPCTSIFASLRVHSIGTFLRQASAPTIFLVLGAGLSSAQQALSTPPLFKTSFDCSRVKSMSVEEAICKNQKLAQLDVEAAEAYRKRLDSTSASDKGQVIASQRRWLTIRNAHNVDSYRGDPLGHWPI